MPRPPAVALRLKRGASAPSSQGHHLESIGMGRGDLQALGAYRARRAEDRQAPLPYHQPIRHGNSFQKYRMYQ